jgi:hypothetical protein
MATNSPESTTERRSLYPPEHPRKRRRYYFDDTLDAHPPLRRLFPGRPTSEAAAAAERLASERGYPPPQSPPAVPAPPTPASPAPKEKLTADVGAARPKRTSESSAKARRK